MSSDELQNQLPELVTLLVAIGQLLPNRVDPDLVEYVDRASKGGIECELLHSALSLVAKSKPGPKIRAAM
jgi:hypothetical protein